MSRLLALLLVGLTACAASAEEPPHLIGLPPIPAQIFGTPAMRALGQKLFFDRGLSVNHTLSCAMCHIPEQAYASNQSALSIGMEGRALRRNAPSLYNVVFKQHLFHDGRETDLVAQAWGPLLAGDEMGNLSIGPLLDRLRRDKAYGAVFDDAFPNEGVTMTTLGRAVASFEATLLIGATRFDRAIFAGEKDALAPQEWRGYALFIGKAGCAVCHAIGARDALFTDQSWHNTGVGFARRNSDATRVELAKGVHATVRLATPMLRGVKDSWPYMHDGSLATLEEVVEFYDRGGGTNPGLDDRIKPLGLTDEEKTALVAFLKAL